MKNRIITAVLGIPLLLCIMYLGGIYLKVLVALLVFLGLFEFSRFFQTKVFWDYLVIAGLSFLILAYIGLHDSHFALWFYFQLFYYLLRVLLSGEKPVEHGWHLFTVFYVVGLFSFIWLIRDKFGFQWLLFGLLVTWATDTGAFYTGMRHGKHKLAPTISPKKTIEGALGGLVFAVITGLIFAGFTGYKLWPLGILALFLSIMGQIGDLVESAIKRERQVKDSGKILPGHGGILDRFDSILFVAPSLYFVLDFILNIA